ncbi:MAG TPA: radical SAM protein [Candidatus Nanoarchaeia archaeon]|nr:radical SAM protein [Candidatus Nanoarchaeia archaeon]
MVENMVFGDSFEDIELSPYKWATHMDKLEAIARGEDVFPVSVELDLVSYCNHNCGWCVDPKHMSHSLERNFVSELLRELKDLGIEGMVFKGGGEGTLHPSYAEILEETKELGFEVGIVTNGGRLLELHKPITKNASYVRVSVDGPTPDSHRGVHKSNDFDNIVAGVKEMVELRDSLGQRHPITGISFAMDYSLIEMVEEAVNLGDNLGVNYVFFRPPFFEEVGRQNTMNVKQKRELLATFEKGKNSYKGKMKIFIDYWISDSESEYFSSRGDSPRRGKYMQKGANGIEHVTERCLASPLLAVVAANKNVYPCCNLRFIEEWSIGTLDYGSGNTFERLWHGEKRKEIIDRTHRIKCIGFCTHPMSKYNEVIEYLRTPQHHRGFV